MKDLFEIWILGWCAFKNVKAISAKKESWQFLNKGLCSEYEYAAAKKAANRAVYDAQRIAEAEEFVNLSTRVGSRDNTFKIAKQMKAANQDYRQPLRQKWQRQSGF